MKIIKRNGAEEDFDNNKIVVAVAKANTAAGKNKLSLEQIKDIADYVEYKCVKLNRAVSVEEIHVFAAPARCIGNRRWSFSLRLLFSWVSWQKGQVWSQP